jgi:hypothetical protein
MSGFDEAAVIFGVKYEGSIRIRLANGYRIDVDKIGNCVFVDLLDENEAFAKLNPCKTLLSSATLKEILQAIIETEEAAYAQGS